jgi:hypothetical protein
VKRRVGGAEGDVAREMMRMKSSFRVVEVYLSLVNGRDLWVRCWLGVGTLLDLRVY